MVFVSNLNSLLHVAVLNCGVIGHIRVGSRSCVSETCTVSITWDNKSDDGDITGF